MDMTNVNVRIDQSSKRLVQDGFELKDMLADGRIDDGELARLYVLADELLGEAVEVADVAADIEWAKQGLTIGRNNTPNRSLQERDQEIELLKSLHRKRATNGQGKAPSGSHPVEANGHKVFESNRK